ncbi:S41 family peptidase [Chromatiaceae bacterium AAb-1]|nr:S41 family peptidase [Chromatiaceae bacterium AAb-1]
MLKPLWIISVISLIVLIGCGDDNSSAPQSTDTWQAGYYAPEASLKNFCEAPRTGIDPYTNRAYPDKVGSSMYEKLWLRSWSNDTYLWYRELSDINPASYNVLQYFNLLKTDAITDSGALKDNFHFAENTADYKKQTQSGVTSGYGIRWKYGSTRPPRSLTVAYTDPGSPADLAGISRGDQLLAINGIDFISDNTQAGVDIINAALFPEQAGEQHQFRLQTIQGTIIDTTLSSADVASSPVQNVQVLNDNGVKTGYLQFNSHIALAQDQLINAVQQFKNENISELVIDLRYNGGGLLALASQLGYMVAGPNTIQGRIFEQMQFNDKTPSPNPTPFYDRKINYEANRLTSTPLPTLELPRVFVLTTDATCSASEAFVNGLRGVDLEVIQIGGKTCGKPYGFYPEDNCGTTYFTIQFSGINAKGFGDYPDGFTPKTSPQFAADIKGCPVEDDLSHALGNSNEAMLNTALHYINNGQCPVVATGLMARTLQTDAISDGLAINTEDTRYRAILLENKLNQPLLPTASEEQP